MHFVVYVIHDFRCGKSKELLIFFSKNCAGAARRAELKSRHLGQHVQSGLRGAVPPGPAASVCPREREKPSSRPEELWLRFGESLCFRATATAHPV